MGSPANIPYQWKLADFTVRDPGASGTINTLAKGFASVPIRTAGAEARTLPAPDGEDQFVKLVLDVDGGDATITVKNSAGSTTHTLTLDDAGDSVLLHSVKYGSTYAWQVVGGAAGAFFDSMTVSGTLSMSTANLDFDGAGDIIMDANTAAALEITDGTTALVAFDTRNTIADVSNVKINPIAPTIATAAAAHLNPSLQIAAKTVTYTGTNTVTSSHGVGLHIGIPTFTDASAGTLSLASNVYVAAVAAAGGSLTLTAARMIATGVSDCYLTNAGVWTDTACWEYGKEMVNRSLWDAYHAIEDVLEKIVPATWKYRDTFEYIDAETQQPMLMGMDDRGRERVGIVYDDLPGELRAPGEERGVSPGILASFCLAAVKMLADKNRDLETRLVALGG